MSAGSVSGNRGRRIAHLYIVAALIFLYAPLAVMMLMAFNRSQLNQLPFTFDLIWFQRLAGNERLIAATVNSLILAVLTALTATALGTLAAIGLTRYTFRGRRLLQVMLVPPITIPWLILAVAMLLLFFWLGIQRSLLTLYLGHVTIQLPYTILVISARLASSDPGLEDAAASLGANPWRTFWRVTFPLALPGILAAGAFRLHGLVRQLRHLLFPGPAGRLNVARRDLLGHSQRLHARDQRHLDHRLLHLGDQYFDCGARVALLERRCCVMRAA